MTKLIYDKKSELEKVHAAAKEIELDKADPPEPIKLHPGSQKALDELNK
ncbi:TAXI family TRAP transporter solute-binding subunit [Brevibacterium sp. ZH18]|nr:TAXI family TRAP transporter solute-binding subunit [Brevibacterium sp. ZH18]